MRHSLDRLHARARAFPPFQRLAIISRLLLAIGFIPPSLVKIRGERFMTIVNLNDPISYFFDAMYRTGAYWRFIGCMQLAAGICLLIPRTATLGAVLFFPVILNIFVITTALHFTGTPVVAGLMLLANFFLLCWDYDRLKQIVFPAGEPFAIAAVETSPLERWGYVLGSIAGLALVLWTRGFMPRSTVGWWLVLALVATIMVLDAWTKLFLSRRSQRSTPA